MNNRENGYGFAKLVGDYLIRLGHAVEPEYSIGIGLNSHYKKAHAFDFGNDNLLVECKYYSWTSGGNNPSAKIATLNEAMMYFHSAPANYSKMLFLAKTIKKGVRRSETLGEHSPRPDVHLSCILF